MRSDVVIVGAGFSGLSAAHYLTKAGLSVEVVEKTEREGGLIHTLQTSWGQAETAATSIVGTPTVLELAREIGVDLVHPMKEARKRYIFRNGKIRRWPLTFSESMGLAWKILGLLIHKKTAKPADMETVRSWAKRVLGVPAATWLLEPALTGIYAGDAEKLSAQLIFGSFFVASPKRSGKRGRPVAPKEGMEAFIKALRQSLEQKGARFIFQKEYSLPAVLGRPHVIATSAGAAAKLLEKYSPHLFQAISQIESLPLLSVTLFFSKSKEDPRGFGCLFPAEEGFHSLGVLWNSETFPGRSAERSETWILGGALSRNVVVRSDKDLLEKILADRGRISATPSPLLGWKITRWPDSIPHYNLAVLNFQKSTLELPSNLHLLGNYTGGLGLAKILDQAALLPTRIFIGEKTQVAKSNQVLDPVSS